MLKIQQFASIFAVALFFAQSAFAWAPNYEKCIQCFRAHNCSKDYQELCPWDMLNLDVPSDETGHSPYPNDVLPTPSSVPIVDPALDDAAKKSADLLQNNDVSPSGKAGDKDDGMCHIDGGPDQPSGPCSIHLLDGISDTPIPLPALRQVKLRNSNKMMWKGQGGVPWLEALRHQAEVLDCKTADCFNQKVDKHAAASYAAIDKAMRALHPDLQAAIVGLCSNYDYPHRAGCFNNQLVAMLDAVGTIEKNKALLKTNKRTLKKEIDENYNGSIKGTLAFFCASKLGTDEESKCYDQALAQIAIDAPKAARKFQQAYHELAAVSVQTLLCEGGTNAVFPLPDPDIEAKPKIQLPKDRFRAAQPDPLKVYPTLMSDKSDKYPEPQNRGWVGLGEGACRIVEHAKASIPDGPFPYAGADAASVRTLSATKTDLERIQKSSGEFRSRAEPQPVLPPTRGSQAK